MEMTSEKAAVTDYMMLTRDGKAVRKATKVIFPGGFEIRFMEKLTKKEALRQAKEQIVKRAALVI